MRELKQQIAGQEAEIQVKQREIANQEASLYTLQSELSAVDSKCSTYRVRIRILREQLREHEAVLEEATSTQSSLRERLDSIHLFSQI